MGCRSASKCYSPVFFFMFFIILIRDLERVSHYDSQLVPQATVPQRPRRPCCNLHKTQTCWPPPMLLPHCF